MSTLSETHRIAWADLTWNPLRGCSRKSAACVNCYAETLTAQNSAPGEWGHGFAALSSDGPGWTGRIELVEERLELPLTLPQGRRIFVNSLSDLFHDDLPDAVIDRVFAVMTQAPQHSFQALTKRPKRMQAYLTDPAVRSRIEALLALRGAAGPQSWPLPNLWLGVTAENQKEADRRIPVLLDSPAAVRFIAAEPLLGPLDLARAPWLRPAGSSEPALDWVVAGGEDGPAARPIQPDWARSLRDQCAAAGTAFFWNEWGSQVPPEQTPSDAPEAVRGRHLDGALHERYPR